MLILPVWCPATVALQLILDLHMTLTLYIVCKHMTLNIDIFKHEMDILMMFLCSKNKVSTATLMQEVIMLFDVAWSFL